MLPGPSTTAATLSCSQVTGVALAQVLGLLGESTDQGGLMLSESILIQRFDLGQLLAHEGEGGVFQFGRRGDG